MGPFRSTPSTALPSPTCPTPNTPTAFPAAAPWRPTSSTPARPTSSSSRSGKRPSWPTLWWWASTGRGGQPHHHRRPAHPGPAAGRLGRGRHRRHPPSCAAKRGWLTAEDGRRVFAAYSLGNFLSTQSKKDQLIGAVLTLRLQKTTSPDGAVQLEVLDPQLHPHRHPLRRGQVGRAHLPLPGLHPRAGRRPRGAGQLQRFQL